MRVPTSSLVSPYYDPVSSGDAGTHRARHDRGSIRAIEDLPQSRQRKPNGFAASNNRIVFAKSPTDRSVPDAHGAEPPGDDGAVGAISITNEVSRRLIPGERLGYLPRNPLGRERLHWSRPGVGARRAGSRGRIEA